MPLGPWLGIVMRRALVMSMMVDRYWRLMHLRRYRVVVKAKLWQTYLLSLPTELNRLR